MEKEDWFYPRFCPVTPAKAGIQDHKHCAGFLDSGLRVIPGLMP